MATTQDQPMADKEPTTEVEKEPVTGLPLGDVSVVGEIFKYLDKIGEPKLKREKTRTQRLHSTQADRNTAQYVEFVNQLTPFLRLISSLKTPMPTIFYQRMVKSRGLLSEAQMKRYKQLFILYLDLIDQVPEDIRKDMNSTTVDLLHHLHTHATDPDSALIGLSPTDDILAKVMERDAGDLVNHSREILVSEILRWSSQEGDDLRRNVRTFAASLRGVDKLKLGEVVIAKTGSRTSFARVSSERSHSGAIVRVFFDPTEASTAPVEGWRMFPLTRQVLDAIRDVKQMEKMIKQNTEGFYTMLHQDMKTRVFNSLADLGFDLTLIQRATDSQTSVLDLASLRKTSAQLLEMADNPNSSILKSSEEYMRSKVDEYISKLDTKTIFMPRYTETLEQLRNYSQFPLARSRLRQLQGACDLAIDNLSLELRKLLNGTRKLEITEWWLKLIETTVNEFLTARKYEFSAVSDNYIESPPADIGLVRKNLQLVQRILDPTKPTSEDSPIGLIEELRQKVYPVIDDFTKKALVALTDSLSGPIVQELNDLPQTLVGLLTKIEEMRAALQPTLAEQLKDMVHDLEYLCEMKRLEYAPAGEKSLHIVPVGGLVMGTFVRLENELKTVIELWDDTVIESVQNPTSPNPADVTTGEKPADSETSASEVDDDDDEEEINSNELKDLARNFKQGQSPLHRAVCTDKLKSVLKIVKDIESAKELVNLPNTKGWTPLHVACLLGNFGICQSLLSIEGIDVACKTEDGTTALHYLVRHPYSEAQVNILNKLLERKAPVSIANRHGETPLHGASLKGNTEVADILIKHGADPNAVTIGGEAPIHYAVTGGATEAVQLLIDSGADPALPANRGTPLELAEGYKHEKIAQHLRASVGPGFLNRGWPRTTRTPPGVLVVVPEVSGGYDEAMRKQIRIGTRHRRSFRKSKLNMPLPDTTPATLIPDSSTTADPTPTATPSSAVDIPTPASPVSLTSPRGTPMSPNSNGEVISPYTPTHITVALKREASGKQLLSPPLSPSGSPQQQHQLQSERPTSTPTPTSPLVLRGSAEIVLAADGRPTSSPPTYFGSPMDTQATSPTSPTPAASDATSPAETNSSGSGNNSPVSSPIQIHLTRKESSNTISVASPTSGDFMFPFSWRNAARSPANNTPGGAFLNRNYDLYSQSPETKKKLKSSDSDNTGFMRKHGSTTPLPLTSVSAPAHTTTPRELIERNINPQEKGAPEEGAAAAGSDGTTPETPQQPPQKPVPLFAKQGGRTNTFTNRYAPIALPGLGDSGGVKLKPAGATARVQKDRNNTTGGMPTMVTPTHNKRTGTATGATQATPQNNNTTATTTTPPIPPPKRGSRKGSKIIGSTSKSKQNLATPTSSPQIAEDTSSSQPEEITSSSSLAEPATAPDESLPDTSHPPLPPPVTVGYDNDGGDAL